MVELHDMEGKFTITEVERWTGPAVMKDGSPRSVHFTCSNIGQLKSSVCVRWCAVECIVECVDDTINEDISTEELVDEDCGLHMSCISSSFAQYNDQPDHGACCCQFFL